ncbi:hypothetical protein EDD18DRAFT_1113506 [Armillaria luteobubalina]|uniref:Uncharacterized protein n=1 Tax=Armillaria luteobubalina TaxID=153913 RepID=A0AA39PA40_9AGAR|nr:hypothetical protein EDD18DRAFT_1113506 [Armillaria luteobubalina]
MVAASGKENTAVKKALEVTIYIVLVKTPQGNRIRASHGGRVRSWIQAWSLLLGKYSADFLHSKQVLSQRTTALGFATTTLMSSDKGKLAKCTQQGKASVRQEGTLNSVVCERTNALSSSIRVAGPNGGLSHIGISRIGLAPADARIRRCGTNGSSLARAPFVIIVPGVNADVTKFSQQWARISILAKIMKEQVAWKMHRGTRADATSHPYRDGLTESFKGGVRVGNKWREESVIFPRRDVDAGQTIERELNDGGVFRVDPEQVL